MNKNSNKIWLCGLLTIFFSCAFISFASAAENIIEVEGMGISSINDSISSKKAALADAYRNIIEAKYGFLKDRNMIPEKYGIKFKIESYGFNIPTIKKAGDIVVDGYDTSSIKSSCSGSIDKSKITIVKEIKDNDGVYTVTIRFKLD
jgi:hypothetical protein